MTHASLFSGIGGFELAAEWMGWSNLFNCEWEEFPRRVLKYHFPKTKQYGDIKELDATGYAGRVDILTGGFPCQPYSLAGKRKGKEDDRHLWPEMLRVIRECTPSYVVGENVRGLVGWNGGLVFEEVCSDLETEGYAVQPFLLPACGVGAPHRRDRIWFIAYANDKGRGDGHGQVQEAHGEVRQREDGAQPCDAGGGHASDTQSSGWDVANPISNQRPKRGCDTNRSEATEGYAGLCNARSKTWEDFPSVAPLCGGDDGLPKELDRITFSKWRKESIKAYGNAIVPQVALQIFKAIAAIETGE